MDAGKASAREAVLRSQGVLDSAAALGLQKTARLAQFVAGSEFAAINLLDGEFQYQVAGTGRIPLARTSAEDSMCLQVVEDERSFYLPDATEAAQFAGNVHTTGSQPIRFYAAAPVRTSAGVTIGTLCVYGHQRHELDDERLGLLNDLAEHVAEHLELHRRVRQLGHSATHDELTGLANRALLSDRLARAMTRRGRRDGEPALAVVDLDGFKAVNDRFGHQAGDQVLVQVAQRLLAAARQEDTVARLGGDEFVVLYEQLPHEDISTVLGKLEKRLRSALDEPLSINSTALPVAASVGFVCALPDELGYEVLGRADALMYEQKASRQGFRP